MGIISIRLEEELLERLQKLAKMEHLDRTNLIKKLLRKVTKEELIENALKLYVRNKITLEQAAELSEVTTWDIVDHMARLGIQHIGSSGELRSDLKRRLKEVGLKKIADEII